jgi:hypothetical protein
MNPVDEFNRIEIVLWAAFGLFVLIFGHRVNGLSVRDRAILSLAFFAFGLSDWAELRSGAWWRPWWLPLLKGGCLAVFAGLGFSIWRKERR